jgi:threonine dehydrogenase-like Zn-dependent dehydrogenase
VWPLPDGISPVAVSGLVLTQVGYNCGARPPVSPGSVALVIGDGMVGQWAAQTLHWRGADVLLAGKHDDRLAFFGESGRRRCVNVSSGDFAGIVRERATSGIDILIDTVGSLPTILACHPLMRPNGHIVSAGFNGTDSLLDIQKLRFGELTLHSPSGWEKRRMDDTLQLIADGALETERLITHRFPVERASEAWKLILDRPKPVLGVLLTWEG